MPIHAVVDRTDDFMMLGYTPIAGTSMAMRGILYIYQILSITIHLYMPYEFIDCTEYMQTAVGKVAIINTRKKYIYACQRRPLNSRNIYSARLLKFIFCVIHEYDIKT
jgi:hypothetical protein